MMLGRTATTGVQRIWKDIIYREVSLATEKRMMEVLVSPGVMYGRESWRVRKQDRNKLQCLWVVAHVDFFLRISWIARVINAMPERYRLMSNKITQLCGCRNYATLSCVCGEGCAGRSPWRKPDECEFDNNWYACCCRILSENRKIGVFRPIYKPLRGNIHSRIYLSTVTCHNLFMYTAREKDLSK